MLPIRSHHDGPARTLQSSEVSTNSFTPKNESSSGGSPVFSLLSESTKEVHLISPRTPQSHKEDTMDAALMLTSMRALISKEISVLGNESLSLNLDDLSLNSPLNASSSSSSSSSGSGSGRHTLPLLSPRVPDPVKSRRKVSSSRARTVSMDSPGAPLLTPKCVNTSQYEKLFASQTISDSNPAGKATSPFTRPKHSDQDDSGNTNDYHDNDDGSKSNHHKTSSFLSSSTSSSFVAISPPSSPKVIPQSAQSLDLPLLREPTAKRKSSCSKSLGGVQSSPRKRQATSTNNIHKSSKALKNRLSIQSPNNNNNNNNNHNKENASSSSFTRLSRSAKPDRVLKKKFSWKNYPELEHFLIANREEYLRHSALNYTMQQKQYNNRLTERLLKLADDSGYAFDEDDFSFVTVRDRIRCYFKSYVQSRKKRGVIIGYAARRAGLLTEEELEKSASVKGRIVVPSIDKKSK